MPECARVPSTVLGFDYGHKKIGVAVGQSITCSAAPLAVLAASAGQPDWQSIQRLVHEWQPQALIVGLPYLQDGGVSASTAAALRFADELRARFSLPVHGMNEYLTSHLAAQLPSARVLGLDACAAQLIVETWFAHRN